MTEKIILVGAGGHARSCIDVIEQTGKFRIAGLVDIKEKVGQKVLGYEIIASDEDLPRLAGDYRYFCITLGQIKSPERRRNLFETLKKLNVSMPVIISPLAYVSRYAEIGEGTMVMHKALVNAGARIGRNCIINTRALIEHDAVIEDHCHIATAAVINGGVRVGAGSFFGSNSTSREYANISEGSIVGFHERFDRQD